MDSTPVINRSPCINQETGSSHTEPPYEQEQLNKVPSGHSLNNGYTTVYSSNNGVKGTTVKKKDNHNRKKRGLLKLDEH